MCVGVYLCAHTHVYMHMHSQNFGKVHKHSNGSLWPPLNNGIPDAMFPHLQVYFIFQICYHVS